MNLVSAKQSAIKLDKEVSAMQYLDNKLEYLNYKMYHLPYLSLQTPKYKDVLSYADRTAIADVVV